MNLTHEGPVRAQNWAEIRQRIERDLTNAGVKIIAPDVARRRLLAEGSTTLANGRPRGEGHVKRDRSIRRKASELNK